MLGIIIALVIVAVITIVLIAFAAGIYNRLVNLRDRYKNAFSQIEVQLKRRYDLIPNLVETAKGYMKHESETLEAVISARNQAAAGLKQAAGDPGNAAAMSQLMGAEGALSGAMGRLFAVMESYPDLKANQNMMQLSEELTSTENKVAFSRQAYNDAVTAYNIYRKTFPPVIFASLFGHAQDAGLLEFDSEEIADAPKVSFESRTAKMDFFAHQDNARKSTGRLVVLFALGVVGIMISTYVVIVLCVALMQTSESMRDLDLLPFVINPLMIAGVGVVVGLMVGGGSAFKLVELRGGGQVVASSLGGRLIYPGTSDPAERRVLNVVEEMAIASGTPVPPVYLMDGEHGINAFAAGYHPGDAVIGVTRGCVDQLSRDELQGVMAHEFSHILNGDMRLNIRLIGLLHGILVIGIVGYFVLRSSWYLGGSRRSRGGGAIPIVALGAGLSLIGFVGTFVGNMIKAAVSRQREYLADASAVQFTRNPSGLADALKRIAVNAGGSTVLNPNAPQASHMFFGRAVSSGFAGMFSTHPPLEQRIHRIEPDWDGSYPKARYRPQPELRSTAKDGAQVVGLAAATAAMSGAAVVPVPSSYDQVVNRIGMLTQGHLAYARQLIDELPTDVRTAVHDVFGAQAVVFGLLISMDDRLRDQQLALIDDAGPGLGEETRRLLAGVRAVAPQARLPLIDIAIPTLENLALQQYRAFRALVEEMIRADGRLDLFEWSLQRVLLRHLEPAFTTADPHATQYYALTRLGAECSLVLSSLAWLGTRDPDAAQTAFVTGAQHLELDDARLVPRESCKLGDLSRALDVLVTISAPLKKRLIIGCAATIHHDREITVREGELLRAICDQLDCPMPPLLPGQPV